MRRGRSSLQGRANSFYERIRPLEEGVEERKERGSTFVPLFSRPKEGCEEEKKEDLEEQVRRAFEEAYQEGERAGYEVGLRRAENLIKRLNAAIAEIERFKQELRERSERLCLELSFLFAEAIVLREIRNDRDVIRAMIKKALEICEEKTDITIRVRKEDARLLSGEFGARIVTDDTLREEGFVIETAFGNIDGTISVQLEELKKRILNG